MMEVRNAAYNKYGAIDCEVAHPEHGWIQFTASPDDVEQHGKDIHASLLESGNIAAYEAPVQTPEQAATQYIRDRKAMHAPVEDQLDMMYWDAVNGTTIWIDYVANIKNTIPKPV